MGIMLFFLCVS